MGSTQKHISDQHHVQRWVTLPIVAMLQHQAQGSQLLCVDQPGSVLHPCGVSWTLSPDHQEHRPAGFVEGFIQEVSLRSNDTTVLTHLL